MTEPPQSPPGAGGAPGPLGPERPGIDPQPTIEALARVSESGDATAFALRYGLARRPGKGIVAGVCAALADAYGLPVRLVRAFAIVLALLGPGVALYLILFLLLPRALPTGDGRETFDVPIRSLARGRVQPGDVVVAVGVLPGLALAGLAAWYYATKAPIALAFLVPIAFILGTIVLLGALHASRARTTYLFASLAERAGVSSHDDLLATIDRLRRDAPRAWGQSPAQYRGEGALEDEAVPSPGRRPRVPTRRVWILVVVATLLAVGLFSLVSYVPSLVPALNPDGPLSVIGRVGLAAATVTLLVGATLIIEGRRGRRSPQLVAIGLVCALAFTASVVWVRLTDSRGVDPIVVAVTEYTPGTFIECNARGVRQWAQPVIIDLSDLEAPPTDAEARLTWQETHPGNDPSYLDLSLAIACYRTVGDVTVILPSSDWRVDTTLSTALGHYSSNQFQGFNRYDPAYVTVQISGQLLVGDITYLTPEQAKEAGLP